MLPPEVLEQIRNSPEFIWFVYWLFAGTSLFVLGLFVLAAIEKLICLAEKIVSRRDPGQQGSFRPENPLEDGNSPKEDP